jgi:hypothetical protein
MDTPKLIIRSAPPRPSHRSRERVMTPENEKDQQAGFVGTIYYILRGIMITIGITPPEPGKEKWVALVFFGIFGLLTLGTIALGAALLRGMMR